MIGFGVAALVALAASPDVSVLRRRVETSDGYAVALYRYAPPGGGTGKSPVLLVADVGLGREAFDLQGSGLAPFLSLHGRDAYVAELRGQGQAAVHGPWALTDWVTRDLPAVVDAIGAIHPGPVDLVVHGYAGTLAMAATTTELKRKVGRVVALSTPVSPEVPNPAVRKLLEGGGRFTALGSDASAFEMVYGPGGRFAPARLQALRGGLSDVPPGVASALLGWMEKGDLPLPDGSTVRGRLASYDRPTLLFLPLLDDFAHPEYASALHEDAPKAHVRVRLLSRFELMREDYTHLSMLQGLDASQDIWTPAVQFLDEGAP